LNGVCARPHPDPLPRGEGEASCDSRKFGRLHCTRRIAFIRTNSCTTSGDVPIANDRPTILPLLEERAGVRAVVSTNPSRIPHPASLCHA
jgi:hypothetical protein